MTFGKKSKAAREQRRIEEAEFVRRQKAGEVRAGAPQAGALAEAEVEERRVYPRIICDRHPQFQAKEIPGVRVPDPPASSCTFCAEDRARARARQAERYIEIDNPASSLSQFPARQRPLIRQAQERYEERQRAAGVALPGTFEAEAAYDRLDELRAEEIARDKRRRGLDGTVVFERVEAGQVVAYVAPHRRGRKGALGLVRVT